MRTVLSRAPLALLALACACSPQGQENQQAITTRPPGVTPPGVPSPIAAACDTCGLEPDQLATDADGVLRGGIPGAELGYDVSYGGDVNGDGMDDLLVGAPATPTDTTEDLPDAQRGRAFLVQGGPGALSGNRDLRRVPAWVGDPGDHAGYVVSGAGDVDGDGLSDLLVTAWSHTAHGREEAGGTWLLYGSERRMTRPTTLGDVKAGDGVALIGDSGQWAGTGAAPAGDLDGDGYGDFFAGAVGASVAGAEESGEAAVFYGSPMRMVHEHSVDEAPLRFVGTTAGGDVGDRLAMAAPDLDGDGNSDVVLGQWDLSRQPYGSDVAVFYSPEQRRQGVVDVADADARLTSTSTTWGYIATVAPGDVDGDGYEDLAVAEPYPTTHPNGTVYLMYGGPSRLQGDRALESADAVMPGDTSDWYLSVSGGDIDGDGKSELVVGSPYHEGDATQEGIVYVVDGGAVRGTRPLSQADAVISGTSQDGLLGFSVDAGGDLDGDGHNDLAIGAWGMNDDRGAVWLFAGGALPRPVAAPNGPTVSELP